MPRFAEYATTPDLALADLPELVEHADAATPAYANTPDLALADLGLIDHPALTDSAMADLDPSGPPESAEHAAAGKSAYADTPDLALADLPVPGTPPSGSAAYADTPDLALADLPISEQAAPDFADIPGSINTFWQPSLLLNLEAGEAYTPQQLVQAKNAAKILGRSEELVLDTLSDSLREVQAKRIEQNKEFAAWAAWSPHNAAWAAYDPEGLLGMFEVEAMIRRMQQSGMQFEPPKDETPSASLMDMLNDADGTNGEFESMVISQLVRQNEDLFASSDPLASTLNNTYGILKSGGKTVARSPGILAESTYQVIGLGFGALDLTENALAHVLQYAGLGSGQRTEVFAKGRDWWLERARGVRKHDLDSWLLSLPEHLQGELKDNWHYLLDPEYLTFQVGEALNSLAVMMTPGYLAKLGASTPAVGRLLAPATTGGLMEAGNFFDKLIADGVKNDKAFSGAIVFGLATRALSQIGGLNKLFEGGAKTPLRDIAGALRVGVFEGISEWLEKPTQAIIAGLAKNDAPEKIRQDAWASLTDVEIVIGAIILGTASKIRVHQMGEAQHHAGEQSLRHDSAEATKVKQQSPEVIKDVAEKISPTQSTHIPAEFALAKYQSDPAYAKAFGLTEAELRTAAAAGHDVEVSTAGLIAHLNKDQFAQVNRVARKTYGSMNLAEVQEMEAAQAKAHAAGAQGQTPAQEPTPAQGQVDAQGKPTQEQPTTHQQAPVQEQAPTQEQTPAQEQAPTQGPAPAQGQADAQGKPTQEQSAPQTQTPVQGQSPAQEQTPVQGKTPAQEQPAAPQKAPVQEHPPTQGPAPAQEQADAQRKPTQEQSAPQTQTPVQGQAPAQEQTPVQEQAPTQGPAPAQEQPTAPQQTPVQEQAPTQEPTPAQGQADAQGKAPAQEQPTTPQPAPTQEQPPAQGQAPDTVSGIFNRMLAAKLEIEYVATANELFSLTSQELDALDFTGAEKDHAAGLMQAAKAKAVENLQQARDQDRPNRLADWTKEIRHALLQSPMYAATNDPHAKDGSLDSEIPPLDDMVQALVHIRETISDTTTNPEPFLLETAEAARQVELVGQSLARKLGKEAVQKQAFIRVAEKDLATTSVDKAMTTERFTAAMSRALRKERAAIAVGDFERAFEANAQAQLNLEYARQSRAIGEMQATATQEAKRFVTMAEADPAARFAVNDIAARYSLMPYNAQLIKGNNDRTISNWIAEKRKEGFALTIDNAILYGHGQSWEDATVSEFESVAGAIAQIIAAEHPSSSLDPQTQTARA